MIASKADHLGREIDPGHARAALGERDGPLTTAAAGVEEARIPAQPQGIPDAIELSIAVCRQGIGLGPGVPTLGAGVPGGAGALEPAGMILPHAGGIDVDWRGKAFAARKLQSVGCHGSSGAQAPAPRFRARAHSG